MKSIYKVISLILLIALVPAFLGERVLVVSSSDLGLLYVGSTVVLTAGYALLFWVAILPAAEALYRKKDESLSDIEKLEAELKARTTYASVSIAPSSLLAGIWMLHIYGSVSLAIMLVACIAVVLSHPDSEEFKSGEGLSPMQLVGHFCQGVINGCGFAPMIVTSPLVLVAWAAKSTVEGRK